MPSLPEREVYRNYFMKVVFNITSGLSIDAEVNAFVKGFNSIDKNVYCVPVLLRKF